MQRLAHLLLAGAVDRVGDEGAGEEGLRLGFGYSTARHVEEGAAVELADGRAVGAFDVVGEDLELGLGVDRRAPGEEQALQRLLAVGLLGAARDLDPGGDRAGGEIVGDRAPDLTAGPARSGVANDEI